MCKFNLTLNKNLMLLALFYLKTTSFETKQTSMLYFVSKQFKSRKFEKQTLKNISIINN